MYGSQQKDLNLPIPTSPYGSRKDEPDLMHHHHHHQHQQQHQSRSGTGQINSGLLRYRSAPSNLLGEMCEDFVPAQPRTSSPETDSMLARFLGADLSNPMREHKQSPPNPTTTATGSHYVSSQVSEHANPPQQMLYHSHQQHMPNHSSVEGLYRTASVEAEQIKAGTCGAAGANLMRATSSPAGFFANLNVENGYGMMRGLGGSTPNNTNNNRLKGQLSFSSSRQGSLMSQISEMGSEGMDGMNSWDDSALLSDNFTAMKRPRDNNSSDSQNGLSHQFSLPKTSSEMAAIEKFLQFQDAVPCKIRAKRGCATHPRSIAERVRRTRISERIRKLQELVPNMDKQTNTADMLDLAVDYIKDLQKQVKVMNDNRANCTCPSSKNKGYNNNNHSNS